MKPKKNYLIFNSFKIDWKEILFKKQSKIILFFKIFVLILYSIYFTINYVFFNNFIKLNNYSHINLESKVLFSVTYWFFSFVSYLYLFKIYTGVQLHLWKIKYYFIFASLFLLTSIAFFGLSLFLYINVDTFSKEKFTFNLNLAVYLLLYVIVLNCAYNFYNYFIFKKNDVKLKLKYKWTIYSYVSKFIYYFAFLIFYINFSLYVEKTGISNIANYPFFHFLINDWKISDFVLKTLLIIGLCITLFPFVYSFFNFWEIKAKNKDFNKLFLWISIISMFLTLLLFFIQFATHFHFKAWNYIYLGFSIVIILIYYFLVLNFKNIFKTDQIIKIFTLCSIFLLWMLFYLIRILFDFNSSKNVSGIQITDINLFINGISNFLILVLFCLKHRKWDLFKRLFVRLFVNFFTLIITIVFYLKNNNLFYLINEFLNIEVLFYSIIIFYILFNILLLSFYNLLILKSTKKGVKNV
ncbi:MSC_0624 family F1-like ATPase-associated membrane protein [Mycoplasma sp. 5370]